MGDPAGIGPEIILKAFSGKDWQNRRQSLVIGSVQVLEKYANQLNIPVNIARITELPSTFSREDALFVFEPPGIPDLAEIAPGKIQKPAGAASRMFIETAVRMIQENKMDALCTAPIHKEAMHLAGFSFPGHTEFLAHLTGTEEFAMLMSGGGIRVVLQTIHTALKNVPRLLTTEKILKKIRLTHEFIPYFGVEVPRIGICGLNPHAGEGGMFGTEEQDIILPAIRKAEKEGIVVKGPFPADTIFHRMLKGDLDVIIAMYHDQALIPVKTLAFYDGVNITMGLPFIRTSVDHGTGFDIAGKGAANPDSLLAAIRDAMLLTENKKRKNEAKA